LVKLSLFLMIGLTVVIATGLRWREDRMAAQRTARPAAQHTARPAATGGIAGAWVAAQKHKLNRWITAAALAAVVTMLFLGGINWLRIWNG
jgi:uncharacterized membrane protein YsdA (DUF1294 family)